MPVLLVLTAAGAGGNTALSRKAGGSKGKRYGAGPATTDEALLSRLGEILGGNMKEDFMVVHLQEPCSFCRSHVHGNSLHKYVNPDRLAPCRIRVQALGVCLLCADRQAMLQVDSSCSFGGTEAASSSASRPLGLVQFSQKSDRIFGLLCRYIGNGAAASSVLSRPPPERRFEGIRLESPGPAAPTGPLAHLQVGSGDQHACVSGCAKCLCCCGVLLQSPYYVSSMYEDL